MSANYTWSPVSWAFAAVLAAAPASALAQNAKYEDEYTRYLESARTTPSQAGIWMGDLMSDRTARRVNDLVTVRVIESLSATGSADSTVNKGSSAEVNVPSPLSKVFQEFLPASADTQFTGAGGTTRTTELSANITARVSEVLPNGDLVIEGIREVDINGDRNVVVLTGVIRSADIQPGNVIVSPKIGQLRIRSLSRGLIQDSLAPGWLVRALNKIF